MKSFTGWSTSCSVTSSPLLLQMSKPTWACWDDNVVACPGKGEWDTSQKIFHLTTLCADTNKITTIFPSKEWNLKDLPSKRQLIYLESKGWGFWMEEKQTPSIPENLPYFPPGFTLHLKWLEAESHRFCILLLPNTSPTISLFYIKIDNECRSFSKFSFSLIN